MRKILSILFFVPLLTTAQLKGIVIDGGSQLPLEGVVILTDNESLVTDNRGFFYCELPTTTIVAKRLGYQTTTFKIDTNRTEITLSLSAEPRQLPEISISTTPFEVRLKNASGSNVLVTVSELQQNSEQSSIGMLNTIPGVFVQQGALNTNRLTIRGIGSRTPYSTNRIKAYFGDIPLTSGDGVTVLEDLDLTGIGRIEVLKGPSSANYGSGLGGVVRLLPAFSTKNEARVISSIGSYNTLRNGLSTTFKNGPANFGLQYANLKSNGYRQNNGYDRHTLFLNGNYHTSSTRLSFNTFYSGLDAQIPSSLTKTDFLNNPAMAAPNWLSVKGYETYQKLISGLTFTRYFGSGWQNKVSLYGGWFGQYESRPFDILEDRSFFWGFREQLGYTHNRTKLALGTEYYAERYDYKLFFTDKGTKGSTKNANGQTRRYINLFAYISRELTPGLTLDAGININWLTYNLKDKFNSDGINIGGAYTYKPIISPRVGINYSPIETVTLFASAGHGFSHPSLEETLQPEGLVNTSLKPEQGYNFDLGSRLTLFDGKTQADITVYKIYLSNLLVTKRDTEDIFYGINAGKTEHQGVELSLSQNLWRNSKFKSLIYQGTVTISDNYFTQFQDDGTDYHLKKLPGIPAYVIFNRLTYASNKKLTIEITYQATGRQYLNDSNSGTYHEYTLLNAKFSTLILQQKRFNFTIFGGIQNILNTHYASMLLVNAPSFGSSEPRYYYPGLPQNFSCGVSVTFN